MRFRYKKCSDGIIRPIISVRLKVKDAVVDYEALVDSGADICLFHADIGELLGIDITKGGPQEILGVGGKASVYYLHRVAVEVGSSSFEIEAGFMPSVSGHVMRYGLVGQRGFFEKFIVKFDLLKEEIELKPRV